MVINVPADLPTAVTVKNSVIISFQLNISFTTQNVNFSYEH